MRRSLTSFKFFLGFHARRTVASVCPLDEQEFVIHAKVRMLRENRRVSTIRLTFDGFMYILSE